jgi:hypothetical protein
MKNILGLKTMIYLSTEWYVPVPLDVSRFSEVRMIETV